MTQNYNHTFSEQDISILKTTTQERREVPLFNEIRQTEFRDYEEVTL